MVAGTESPEQSLPTGRADCPVTLQRRPWLLIPAKAVLLFKRAIYIPPMSSFEFCLPTRATTVPAAPEWFHEIKYDGYRLRLERDGARVRLITKGGYDWTKRYPWIVEAALKNRQSRFVIDGEAVILGIGGRSDFNALHSNRQNDQVHYVPSTCWRWAARICASCPFPCAK